MRKIIAGTLVLLLILSFSSCGENTIAESAVEPAAEPVSASTAEPTNAPLSEQDSLTEQIASFVPEICWREKWTSVSVLERTDGRDYDPFVQFSISSEDLLTGDYDVSTAPDHISGQIAADIVRLKNPKLIELTTFPMYDGVHDGESLVESVFHYDLQPDYDLYCQGASVNGKDGVYLVLDGTITEVEYIDGYLYLTFETIDGDLYNFGIMDSGRTKGGFSDQFLNKSGIIVGVYLGFSDKLEMPSCILTYFDDGEEHVFRQF